MSPEHGLKLGVPVSIVHSNVAASSVDEKPKVGRASSIWPVGPPSIDTCGGWVSTVKARVAVVELPAASVAVTRKV